MYRIVLHELVSKQDFKKISSADKSKIIKTIYKKLSVNPEVFGKPLAGDLKGLFRLRIGFYRVVYKIEKEKVIVFVLNVGLRKDFLVYMEAAKRLQLL